MSALRAALDAGALDARRLVFVEEWRPAQRLWRVYSQTFGPTGFNATELGFARFSPLRRPDGSIVLTLYAGQTLDIALMENVFREAPSPSQGHILTLPLAADEQHRVTHVTLGSRQGQQAARGAHRCAHAGSDQAPPRQRAGGEGRAVTGPESERLPLLLRLRESPSGAARTPPGPARTAALGRSGLHRMLKAFFESCARSAPAVGLGPSRFEAASTHWLRHTFGRQMAAEGVLRQAFGHASLATTSHYIDAETEHSAMLLAVARQRRGRR